MDDKELRIHVDLQFSEDMITWDVCEVTPDNYLLIKRGFAPVVRDALFDAGTIIEDIVPEVFL